MKRNILLVEPGYKTKFPPLGLMKISAYHKQLGDNVKFVKGINEDISYECYWDRIYISTVFTYNWNITVKTINFYKSIVQGDITRIYVGGILASLMPNELSIETGITPIKGILSKPGALNDDNILIVDKMIPDYELFDDTPYEYALIADSYFGYSTRGCPNKCEFCGVKTLEPEFIEYKGIKTYIKKIKRKYGEKSHLVLFDNNILASEKLERIIDDIIDLGFGKDSKIGHINQSGQVSYRLRHVDFNQGIDARKLKEKEIKLLSKIALNPMRIAFDHINLSKIYKKRIQLAAKYDIRNLSNYILYNHQDKPEDLWNRLDINIKLNREHDLKIYSFPMKYIPLDAKDRSYVSSPQWNWQLLRGVQRILNVVKGIVMPGEDFFYRAFGASAEEFREILHMPELIVMNRKRTPQHKEIEWKNKFKSMTKNEQSELLEILCTSNTKQKLLKIIPKIKNNKINKILDLYLPEEISDEKQMEIFN